MAAVSCVLSEDQFLCAICLEVFTDPVSTSCGHSFCKACIDKYWENKVHCQCPVCKEDFSSRPQLKINTFVSEIVCQFKKKPREISEPQAAGPGEVTCDICTETKNRARKSCLVCLASYCETHLEPHLNISRLKRHQLINPVENLEDRICIEHDKLLELFCKTDRSFICLQCSSSEHKTHAVVPLKKECEVKQEELKLMIEKRHLKIEEIQRSVALNQKNADREMTEGIKLFSALMESVQKILEKFREGIEETKKNKEEEAAELIKQLEQEVSELETRSAEMEQLSEDHLHFLQTFTSVKPAPVLKDWTHVTVDPLSYEGTIVKAVSELDTQLHPLIKMVAELKRVQQYALDVTLDPDSAHPNLIVSYDKKQVYDSNMRNVPGGPDRFSVSHFVLGEDIFDSGRYYFQVQVKGKTAWTLGVAEESINRKISINLTPQNGFWTISLRNNNQYKANDGPSIVLSLESAPENIGVFVDYDEDIVSFYDVDTAALIWSFTDCNFTENLFPFFGPCSNKDGTNPAPLIINTVY